MVENLGLNSTAITTISVDPNNPNIVVVETRGMSGADPVGGAIFKTINGGASWEETYNMGGYDLQYLNGTLYATTFHSLLESTNFGTTWRTIVNFTQIITSSLVLDNGSKIYIGLWSLSTNVTDQILESTNYGATFRLLENFTQSEFGGKEPSISQIIASPSDNSKMWAIIDSPFLRGNGHGLGNPSLFSSTDGGMTWEQVNTTKVGMGYLPEPPTYITYGSINGSIIYVVGNGYIFRSTNGGINFTGLTPPSTSLFIGELNVDPLNSNILFLCSETGLYRSFDDGKTWTQISDASTDLLLYLAVDNQSIFAVGEGTNPLYSTDLGSNWTTNAKGYLGVVAVDPYNSSIVIIWTETHTTVGGPFFFVSNDGGKSFFLPDINFTAEVNPNVENIAFSRNEIFVPGGDGIFASTDGGLTWSLINDSPSNASTVVDSPSAQNILYASNDSGLFVSQDNGILWRPVNTTHFESLAVDPLNSSILAATELFGSPYSYRAMISYNGGKTFEYMSVSSVEYELSSSYIYFEEVQGKTEIVFISDQGLYLSDNMGRTWINASYNLPSTLINSFFSSSNGTSYVATYGSGIYVDPQLFNFSFFTDRPILTGFIGPGNDATIDGTSISGPGYFSLDLTTGNNSINWDGEKLSLVASSGNIYFLNFSNMQIHLTITEENLTPDAEWNVTADGHDYSIRGNGSITLPLGTSGISVLPVVTDYSIYYPSKSFYSLTSSLIQSVTVQFNQTVKAIFDNFTSAMSGMLWSTQEAYNRGYILYAGGNFALLNTTTKDSKILTIRDFAGQAYSVIPFSDGFMIAGSASSCRPGIYFYNISSGLFTNYSSYLPAAWDSSYAAITSIFRINSTAFGFIGGGVDSAFFGMIDSGKFTNLSSYLPSWFTPSNSWYFRYSAAYIPYYQGIVISDGSDVGIFYLSNRSFYDISSLMPTGFFVGTSGIFSPSNDFISSNVTTAVITGVDYGQQSTFLFTPNRGIKNISSLFPSFESMDSVEWIGGDIILSGHDSKGMSSPIFIYNVSRNLGTGINTSYYGNTSLIDSTLIVHNSIYFTTFNTITVPNQTYVIDSSYFGSIGLTPTGILSLKLNTPATVELNNRSYYIRNGTIPEFAGNYTLFISSPGHANYSATVDIRAFGTVYLNITLVKQSYEITFYETGLPEGTTWSVTLNGTTSVSSTNTVTFSEPDGTYSYTISTTNESYKPSPYSGYFTVNGTSVSMSATFSLVKYTVTFIELGLSSGTSWSLTLNGTTESSSTNTISFSEPNGSYFYSVSGPSGYTISNSSGTITLNGKNITQKIIFIANASSTYAIIFIESGLPSGSTWSVTINGITKSSTNSTITFILPESNYSYSVSLP
ncbi:MAG: hypothetical protein QW478_10040, partial [Candidatus Micrarchaeaceae archaeon]